jgi:hypothetical protein
MIQCRESVYCVQYSSFDKCLSCFSRMFGLGACVEIHLIIYVVLSQVNDLVGDHLLSTNTTLPVNDMAQFRALPF